MAKRKKNYSISEWPVAEMDSLLESATQDRVDIASGDVDWDWTDDLTRAQVQYTAEANRAVTEWVEMYPDKAVDLIQSDDYESEDDIAWNTWAHTVGHGVGFWEHMSHEDYDSLSKSLDVDSELSDAHDHLSTEMDNTIYYAIEKTQWRQLTSEIDDEVDVEWMSSEGQARYEKAIGKVIRLLEEGEPENAVDPLKEAAAAVRAEGEDDEQEQAWIKRIEAIQRGENPRRRNPPPQPVQATKKLKAKLLR